MNPAHLSFDTAQGSSVSLPPIQPDRPGLPPGEPLFAAAPDEALVNDFPVSRAKVTPPPVREETLSRERLLRWLEAAVLRRVVFVVADAGYGKTTLLADFSRHTRFRCLWFKLDEPDRDWLTFLHYVVAAGREAVPGFAPTTASLLARAGSGEPIRDAAIQALASELGDLGDEPTAFIFDDYHLVESEPTIAKIVQRMIRAAPERLSLVFLSRRRPSLRVARLHALDEIRELGRDELRFRRDETERLFSDSYQQPLEEDVLDEVDSRTEGWAASLQLLQSGLRGRTPAEVRAFVRRLSGAEGRLYDYLAEEVVGDLPGPLRRFLVRTSVLDRVTPELARAALAAGQAKAPTAHECRALIQQAEELGLLSRRGESTRWSHRYHPLIRDYLLGKLADELDPEERQALHRSIAREAEATSWAAAAHHWLEAGDAGEVVSTIERQIAAVAASGQYSLAADYLTQARVDGPGEIAGIVQARIDLYAGRVDRAQDFLAKALQRLPDHSPEALQLLMSIAHSLGDVETAAMIARALLAIRTLDPWQLEIARAVLGIRDVALSGSVVAAQTALEQAALVHEQQRRWHLAAVSRFNLADLKRIAGSYLQSVQDARSSIDHFARSGGDAAEIASAYAVLGSSLGALDRLDEAAEAFRHAEKQSSTPIFQLEVAMLRAEHLSEAGEIAEALSLARRAVDAAGTRPTISMRALTSMTGADIATRAYAFGVAYDWLARFDATRPTTESAGWAHQKLARARLQLLNGEAAQAEAADAHDHAKRQGAFHWAWRAALVAGAAARDRFRLEEAIAEAGERAPAALRSEAAVLCSALDLFEALPPALEQSTKRSPLAWRPHLRHRLADPNPRVRLANAHVLERIGEWADVPTLRRLARDPALGRAGRGLGIALVKTTAPRVLVEDLGRTRVGIGSRVIEASAMRRKSAALLTYLLTRPGYTAAREQVLEALWPDSPPEVGKNSLHQTVYFLRRDLEPDYADQFSAGYVRLEGELVWMDPGLVESTSRQFAELAASAEAEPTMAFRAIGLYKGKFAPEFEYEDWAIATRDGLHAAYLALVARTLRHCAEEGDWLQGAATARLALSVDPSAEDIEKNLIALYHHAGSHAAAAEQYSHFAASQRAEYGVEPPPLEVLLTTSDRP